MIFKNDMDIIYKYYLEELTVIQRIFYLILVMTISLSFAQDQNNPEITISELQDHLVFLASDSLKGRKPGTSESRIAAGYIRDELKKNGLTLLGDQGFQYFEVTTSVKAGMDNYLNFAGFEGRLDEHFCPLSFSEDKTITAPVVFVGYGFDIQTDSLKWNDYAGLDAKGKIVMVLRGDPDVEKDSSAFEPYSSLRSKVLTAQDHGAVGVLFVSGVKFDKDDELIGVSFDESRAGSGMLVMHIKRIIADSLLKPLGQNIAALEEGMIGSRQPKCFAIDQTITAQTETIRNKVTTQNIVGVLPGSDKKLKDEYVVLGAHYDHLGMGGQGSGSRRPDTVAVHNGADDNASGVSAILEIIEKLAAQRKELKRSVVFIAFGAEELGVLGSKYFIDHPLVDLNKIKFMFNLDMVGRMSSEGRSVTMGGSGTAVGLNSIIENIAAKANLNVNQSPEGYGPSDHASFYMKDIPVAFIFSGMHDDYHTPADDADKINYEGEKEIADFVYAMLTEIANRSEALAYQEAGPKEIPADRRRYKVTLGIMPDFSGTAKEGLRADAVMKGRPAERAGMKKGDVIVAIEGKPVKNIYDYMGRLNTFKKGQRISVDVLREGQKMVLIVDL